MQVKRFCQAHGQLFVDTRASEKSLQPEEKQQRQQFLNFFGSLDERECTQSRHVTMAAAHF
jgi:hypothetical protein